MSTTIKNIVLTGASGTLGARVLAQLAGRSDVRVLALLRKESRIREPYEDVRFERVDFFDRLSLPAILTEFQPNCVIHCAASGVHFPRPQWFDLVRFNIDASIHLCECVAAIPGCQFVFISTGLAYRETGRALREDDALDTLHPYGASKAAADMLVRSAAGEFGVPLTVFRPFSFTGISDDGSRLFPALLRAALEGGELNLSPGQQCRDHCAVDDVAWGVVRAALDDQRIPLRVFNLGSGRAIPLRDLVEEVVEQLGLQVRLNFGARPYARFEPMHLVADPAYARNCLGWEPRTALPYAVWQLAKTSFSGLEVREPQREAVF